MTLLGAMPVASCESAGLCSCIHKEPLKDRVLINMRAAEGVLLATVEDTIAAEGERPPMAVLRVSRWWKGGDTDTLRVGQRASNTMMTSCDRRLNVNETYILFLPRRPGLWF